MWDLSLLWEKLCNCYYSVFGSPNREGGVVVRFDCITVLLSLLVLWLLLYILSCKIPFLVASGFFTDGCSAHSCDLGAPVRGGELRVLLLCHPAQSSQEHWLWFQMQTQYLLTEWLWVLIFSTAQGCASYQQQFQLQRSPHLLPVPKQLCPALQSLALVISSVMRGSRATFPCENQNLRKSLKFLPHFSLW